MRRAVLIALILAGCGGGGPSPVDNVPRSEVLTWKQPAFFNDNTPMDIRRDVARWDIYCANFDPPLDNDIVASVVTPDNLAFNMALLRLYGYGPGPDGSLVFLKCIGIDNQGSVFSEPAWWTN
jgi:hypothetical protein